MGFKTIVELWGFIVVSALTISKAQTTRTNDFLETPLIQRLERDVLAFAQKVEEAYQFNRRCDASILTKCDRSNYDECNTILPNLTCEKKGHDLEMPICAEAGICTTSGFDITTSAIRIPPFIKLTEDGNPDPSNTEVIETICYTQQLDQWFQQKREEDLDYYRDNFGTDPPQYHYGARNGLFRLYPARPTDACHSYDPTTRPWYVAGSSGPKNVVLVLDTSGSMDRDCENCLSSLQQAAKRIVNSLSIGDYVAIVTFNGNATIHADPETGFLYQATRKNKEDLLQAIDNITALGGTNFYEPLEIAFDALDKTIMNEVANCNSAILFLTDGRVNIGGDGFVGNTTELTPEQITLRREDAVMDLVQRRMATSTHQSQLHGALTNQVLFFSYSIDGADSELHAFPKRLACEASENGVWSKIVQPDQIIESLSSYYLLFSIGLADGKNANFTTWVEPYQYASTGLLGTTVSCPVFDRSVQPALFLGVVGIDLPMSVVDEALGVHGGSAVSTNGIFKAASFKCPVLGLPTCVMESFRAASGEESRCKLDDCTESDIVRVKPGLCPHETDYTVHPLAEATRQGITTTNDKNWLCCEVPKGNCSAEIQDAPTKRNGTKKLGLIVALPISALVVVVLVLVGLVRFRCSHNQSKAERPTGSEGQDPTEEGPLGVPGSSPVVAVPMREVPSSPAASDDARSDSDIPRQDCTEDGSTIDPPTPVPPAIKSSAAKWDEAGHEDDSYRYW